MSEDLNQIFAKAGRIGIGLGAISSILGAKALTIWAPLPWIIGGSVFFLSGVAAWFLMKEEYFVQNSHSFSANLRHSKRMVCEGFVAAIRNRTILLLFLLGVVGCISIQALNMQWAILFKPVVGGNVKIGFLAAIISLCLAFGTGMAPKLKERFSDERSALIWTQSGIGVCIILAVVLLRPYFVIPAFLLHEMLRGAYQPMKDSYLQHSIKVGHRRATISSFESISNHLGAIIGLVLSGLFAVAKTIELTWIVSGCFMIVGTLLIAKIIRK